MTWLMPEPGARVRQTRPHGPFVVQRRDVLGYEGVLLTRHPDPTSTEFVVLRYEERSEIGLPCFVTHLEDERDSAAYVVDTGIMGPGLPADTFALLDGKLP
jgi:hypothetical protein